MTDLARRPRIVAIPGDSIGPEIVGQALRVLEWFAVERGFSCDLQIVEHGAAAYRRTGSWLRESDLAAIVAADAVLFGAVGSGPDFEAAPIELRRGFGIIALRRAIGAFANLRPIRPIAAAADASPLKPEITRGVDMLIVRELGGGLYTGRPRGTEELADGGRRGFNTQTYETAEVRRVARLAFELARARRKDLVSVDKSNVLESGMVWRQAVGALREAEYPDVAFGNAYVDTCAIELMAQPRRFDVVLLDNMFGDILSDEASVIVGSVGLLPSASIGERDPAGRLPAIYEPLHEPSHAIAGRDTANPIGAIRCVGLALEQSFGRAEDARLLEAAVEAAIAAGARTLDFACGGTPVSTTGMGDAVLAALDRLSGT